MEGHSSVLLMRMAHKIMRTQLVHEDQSCRLGRLTLLRVSGSNSHDIVPYSGQKLIVLGLNLGDAGPVFVDSRAKKSVRVSTPIKGREVDAALWPKYALLGWHSSEVIMG